MTPSPAYGQIQSAALERGGLVSMSLDTKGDDLVVTALYCDRSTDAIVLGKVDDDGIAAKVPRPLFDSFEEILEDREWANATAKHDAMLDALAFVMDEDETPWLPSSQKWTKGRVVA